MTKDQIEALVSKWLEEALEDGESWRETYGPITDEREPATLFIQDGLEEAQEALASNDYNLVKDEVASLLMAANLPIPNQASAEYGRLCRRFLRAKVEFARIQLDRWRGEYRDDHQRKTTVMSALPTPTPTSSPFSVVLEKYFVANPRPARTADPMKAEFIRFMEAVGGDKPIATVTKADGVQYKESLQLVRKCHPTTCMKHISNADAFFRWAEVHGHIPERTNPMKGLGISKRQSKKAALKRRPFSDEELLTVFGSQEFLRQRMERPERYWVVLLCLFQACRREEAAQLYIKDIQESEGVTYLNITDTEKDQTLKNEGSRRRVPLHVSLIKLGFLNYVAVIEALAMKEGRQATRLFPQLTRKGNNGYADPVGKWFGRMVTDLGLTDPRLVIHSLRHGGITKLHSAGVPGNIVETLVGHSAGNVHEQYVHKELLSVETLKEGLEKLQYPEVVQALNSKGQREAAA